MAIYREELDKFFTLLTTDSVRQLLEKDRCNNHVDNYLLAMVFVYFKRAGLSLVEFTVDNFWLCLYLAHDQEEDEEELKWELLPWALGPNWRTSFLPFLVEKDQLWMRMDCRSVVSSRQCEQIMAISASAGVWGRVRGEEHGGAVRRGEGHFEPGGPAGQVPLCVRCQGQGSKGEECFLVSERMDMEEGVDRDSGMETEGELEQFPEN